MVAGQGLLSDLAQKLQGFKRRRRGGHPRHHRPAGLSQGAGGGHPLALAGVQKPAGGRGLRHRRLPGHRPPLRHHGGHGAPAGGDQAPGHVCGDGPGGEPLLRRAPLVPEGAGRPGRPLREVFLLPQGQKRRAAHQLARLLRRQCVEPGARPGGPLLPAPVLQKAAGSRLGEPRGAPRGGGDGELVAGQGRGGLPGGRHREHRQAGAVRGLRPRPAGRPGGLPQDAGGPGVTAAAARLSRPAAGRGLCPPQRLHRGRGVRHRPRRAGPVHRAGRLFLQHVRLCRRLLGRQPQGLVRREKARPGQLPGLLFRQRPAGRGRGLFEQHHREP